MTPGEITSMQPYIARLRELPFVAGARVRRSAPGAGDRGWDALLELRVGGETHRFFVAHKRTPRLNYSLVENLLGTVGRTRMRRWILLAPFITSPMAAHLQKRGVNYVDLNGNCHLAIDRVHVAVIEGRRPARRLDDERHVGLAAHKVFFALLADDQLVQRPVREIADSAGVGKTQAAIVVRRLKEEGSVTQGSGAPRMVKPAALLERWVAGYSDVLRPRLFISHYRTADKRPAELEDRIERALKRDWSRPELRGRHAEAAGDGRLRWAWGGAAAAYRLTGHYRGDRTILHVEHAPPDLAQRLRLLPTRTGPLTLLRVPGPAAFHGAAANTVHPLLVYAELLAAGEDRSRDAALEIRESFLRHLG